MRLVVVQLFRRLVISTSPNRNASGLFPRDLIDSTRNAIRSLLHKSLRRRCNELKK
jgi:hypothetical protein